MTQFKAGDKVQFDADAVHEADRLDKEEFEGTRGYAEGIIRKGGLETGGVIERSDYDTEAPFQIKLPDGKKCWAEEEWLKTPDKFQPGDVVKWVYSDGSQRANGYWDGSTIVERGTTVAYKEHYKVRRSDGTEGVIHGDDLRIADKFKPGDLVDWVEADKYWRGVEVIERKDFIPWGSDEDAEKIEGYRVYGPLPGGSAAGLIAASELVLHPRPYSMTFTVVPEVKDPNAPTVEELKQGINITDYIEDIVGFKPFPHQTKIIKELVDHPAHYGGEDDVYEVIKVIEAWGLGFHLGNAVKYIPRAGVKDPDTEIQDLEKARWYIDRRIQWLKENEDA